MTENPLGMRPQGLAVGGLAAREAARQDIGSTPKGGRCRGAEVHAATGRTGPPQEVGPGRRQEPTRGILQRSSPLWQH